MEKKYIEIELLGKKNVKVKNMLTLQDMMGFVDYVVGMCFSDDGEYLPELREFAVMSCIVEYYTDFELPENASDRYDFLYETNIAKFILDHVNIEQYKDMMSSICNKIDNLAKANIEMVNAQMNKLNEEFNMLIKNIEGLFSGVSNEDMENAIKVINEGIDKNEIIKSLVEYKDVK